MPAGIQVEPVACVHDLDPSVEPEQIAFELDALGAAAHQQFQLMHDPAVFDRAERAISARLDALATKA